MGIIGRMILENDGRVLERSYDSVEDAVVDLCGVEALHAAHEVSYGITLQMLVDDEVKRERMIPGYLDGQQLGEPTFTI